MLALIFLMSSLFWRFSTANALSSWVWVLAIWKNGQANGIEGVGEAGGKEGWVGPLIIMVSSDRYHCDQVEKGNPMG
jgi:hypothetical protein